VPDS